MDDHPDGVDLCTSIKQTTTGNEPLLGPLTIEAAKNSSRVKSSLYKGVSYHKRDKRWTARVHLDGKTYHIGTFSSEELAALSVDLKLRGKANTKFNFPDTAERIHRIATILHFTGSKRDKRVFMEEFGESALVKTILNLHPDAITKMDPAPKSNLPPELVEREEAQQRSKTVPPPLLIPQYVPPPPTLMPHLRRLGAPVVKPSTPRHGHSSSRSPVPMSSPYDKALLDFLRESGF
jgi:hypothetical protein